MRGSSTTTRVVPPGELLKELEARSAPRPPRSAARPRRGRARRLSTSILAGTLLAFGAATVYGAITTVNIQVANQLGYEAATTDEGAIVEYIGDANTSFGSSGTGTFDSFVRVQADDDEKGYNTDGDLEFDTKSGNFTHSILVSEIPVVECESLDGSETAAGGCFELFADLNENNSTPLITLDGLEVYFTTDAELTGYPFVGTATKVFDSDDQVQINDVNQGSGRGDLRYLVPISAITIPTDCDYGNAACDTYFVLYSEYGFADGSFDSDGGFEEWKVKRYPFLSVTKTATTSFTRTFPWTIEKTADPATWDLFDGDSGTSDWTIDVTKGDGVDSAWAVSGTITIENSSDEDAVLASVTDAISGGVGNVAVSCGVTFPHDLDAGDSLECTYTKALTSGASLTNTATATLDTSQIFTGTAPITFGAPTTLVNDTVDVTDTNGMSWDDVADDDSFTYSETFECDDDEGVHNNTATITQTGQNDSASVTVTCYDLDIVKTAVPTFSRDFDWTIEKTVDPLTIDLFDGDSGDAEWTVEWTKSAAQDSTYAVSGTITITNNHPTLDADLTQVVDSISGVGDADTLNCPSLTVLAADDLVCTYSSDLPDDATRTNTATATQQNYDYASDGTPTAGGTTDYTDTESIDFTGVNPTVTDDTATLSDARPGNTIDGDNVSASGEASWTETFECGDDEGDHTNSATVTEDDSLDSDTDDATVTVNCYGLTVTKDADTSLDRDYDWNIDKTRVFADGEIDGDGDPATLTLTPDQMYTLTYEITVDLDGYTDAAWAVAGTITVTNPAPIAADDVVVSDTLSDGTPVTVDCDDVAVGNQTTVDIPANDSVDCSYSADLLDADTLTNTAKATLFGIDYTGDASVDFTNADVTEIDECITVKDDNGTPADTSDDETLGTVCADDPLPHTFTHTIDIGPLGVEACGASSFTNTASYATVDDANDTDEADTAEYTVAIDVPCPEGCTLTLGYWKTHNATFHGGAPADPNWFLIGDVDGDGDSEGELEDFFDTGKTWYEVFWTNVSGRPYYQLAHQWMAAYINALSIQDLGGSIPASVQTALTTGAALLDEYDGSEAGKNPDIKGKNASSIRAQFTSLAGTLGAFNEGDLGPGHCDDDGTRS